MRRPVLLSFGLLTGCELLRDLGPEREESAANDPAAVAAARTPLRVSHGLPHVEARLPGGRRGWFVIDTGAGEFTLIDQDLGTELGLKYDVVRDPEIPFIHLCAQLAMLEVDGMGRRDLTVYATDVRQRPALLDLGVPVDGVLGTGFFRDHCLRFDWGRGEFTAVHPRRRVGRQVPIPLRFGARGELYFEARIDGRKVVALLDTAAPRTLVAKALADEIGLAVDAEATALHVDTAIGPAAVREGVLPRLSLQTEEILDLGVAIVEGSIPHAQLLVGSDVLARYGVILDLSDRPYLVLDPEQGGAAARAPGARTDGG